MLYKNSLVILFMCCANIVTAQTKLVYNPFIDVQHYTFNLQVNDANDSLYGEAAITVVFTQATNALEFDLINANAKGKGMQVQAVAENEIAAQYTHQNDKLSIQLNHPAAAGEQRTYTIQYRGIPADGLYFSKNQFGKRTIFGDNYANRARNWLPCVDHLSDKASVDFIVTAPEHYQVISNGIQIEKTSLPNHFALTHWQETVNLPTKVMVIGLADFAVGFAGMVDCIPVQSWVFPQHKEAGFYDYAQATEILPFFIQNVGPYAFKKLANVEAITIFGGMENASAIFYSEKSITGKRGYSEELIAHEIAHQWFGDAATEADWPHVWLSEGFATEMANLYMEHKYGADSLAKRMQTDRDEVIDFSKDRFTPIVDTSEKKDFLELLNANSYQKGGWVLHMLRRKLGDALFWKGIQQYYATYNGKNASTDDLRKVMEAASGMDLKEFFTQWLYTPGQPVLDIAWHYDAAKSQVKITITQQQQNLFNFPIELAIKTATDTHRVKISAINKKVTDILVTVDAKPLNFIVDPNTNLLYEGKVREQK